ncbi:hypothetical protein BU23DRAFT_466212 [Bimuria novae-zelandiae CBS 107.79]|uniref:N(6)-L-threonylcarbamoyladenine synthase n=1 Tax=Bimuria novae-zelandiae CBS 107.79 TaxID=1447943 RepID=A0A6A5V7D5_9PLEO|nr:hypothetical protein BU23DRAFT_466212 [Bimuria novae-zelandiae CBS 107.79]
MRVHLLALRPVLARAPKPRPRRLVTLAIETSCDDTSVAILEAKTSPRTAAAVAQLHFHDKVTSNNAAFNGVHPLAALESHQENLAMLVCEAIKHLPDRRAKPDFVSVTRGPGMRSNLFTGLDTAKGLAAAWNASHALTPRLVAALDAFEHHAHEWKDLPERIGGHITAAPHFPFLSVLASGGHTLLVHTATLTSHEVLGSTSDVAIGEFLDKAARVVLPPEMLRSGNGTMYGALLEEFAFPSDRNARRPRNARSECKTAKDFCKKYESHYAYTVPRNQEEELKRNVSRWGWAFNQPLARASGGLKNKNLEMSFSGLMTAVERAVGYQHHQSTGKLTKIERSPSGISLEERRDMAESSMRAAFEHIAARVVTALKSTPATTVVMAGGVGANIYLRYILASMLCKHGFGHLIVVFPPTALCSDNAAMIAWTGIEMYQSGYTDKLSIRAVRKWPLDQLLSPPVNKTT